MTPQALSTGRQAPLIIFASSEARNRIAFAISPGAISVVSLGIWSFVTGL
jgi:hypothetical protein